MHRSHESRISSIDASLSPDPLQPRAVHFEPLIGGLPVSVIQGIKPGVKGGTVVHMANMRDLMRNDGPAHINRCHDQPPA